jgi:probable phosphoglycerate mutase
MIRHAQSIWHEENKYAGLTDIEISKVGHEQSQTLSNWAKMQDINAIWTSNLKRTIQTANPTSETLGLVPIVNENFREVNFGQVEGLNPIEFAEKFPAVEKSFQEVPADTDFPNGENGRAASIRALDGLSLISQSSCKEIMLVSHGTILRLMFCQLLGMDINNYRRFFPSLINAAINTFVIPENCPSEELRNNGRLVKYNCTPS